MSSQNMTSYPVRAACTLSRAYRSRIPHRNAQMREAAWVFVALGVNCLPQGSNAIIYSKDDQGYDLINWISLTSNDSIQKKEHKTTDLSTFSALYVKQHTAHILAFIGCVNADYFVDVFSAFLDVRATQNCFASFGKWLRDSHARWLDHS
jgi:hypothetical protein